MKHRLSLTALSVVLFASVFPDCTVAYACGPFFPNDYFVVGGKTPVQVIELSFFHELTKALKRVDPKSVSAPDDAAAPSPDQGDDSAWRASLEADVEELSRALKGASNEDETLVDQYRELREAMRAQAAQNHEQGRGSHSPFGRLRPISPVVQDKETPVDPFDLEPYKDMLSRIPREFALYAQGACAYYNDDMDKAKDAFAAVLALPEDQRKFRSTWAAFMLGKSCLRKAPERSIEFFKQTRDLAEHGFADTLDLAHASTGWEARAHTLTGNFVSALHGYAEMASSSDEAECNTGYTSIDWICQALFEHGSIDPRLAEDPLTRAIITTYVMCEQAEAPSSAWLDAMEKSATAGTAAPDDADKIAWLAYNKGDMAAADRWLRQADPKSAYGEWTRAKLLMRDGKLAEAAGSLKTLVGLLDPNDKWLVRNSDPWFDEYTSADQIVRGELGALNLAQGDYGAALDLFIRADEWADAAYIAERVMSVDELDKAVTAIPANDPGLKEDTIKSLRHLFARRLARLGQWEKAMPYFPDDELRSAAKKTAEALVVARETNSPGRDRAKSIFDAAASIREHGLELMGTEWAPDWFLEAGEFELEITRLNSKEGMLRPAKEELERARQSATQPEKRYHYRYRAAELMWECAALLPDNDTLTAEALYEGGTYLKNRDPEAADRFYKALVRRNPNLAIAQEADRLRWFPGEFSPVVLYQHRPPHFPKRKLFSWGVAVMGCFALLGAAWALRQMRTNKRTT